MFGPLETEPGVRIGRRWLATLTLPLFGALPLDRFTLAALALMRLTHHSGIE